MLVNDLDRMRSFVSGITSTGVDILFRRIKGSSIPGIYDPEFVGISLGNGDIRSVALYLIEPPMFTSHEQIKQRLVTARYYSQIFDGSEALKVFFDSGCPIRIDPSYKSLDDEFVFRLEPQFDYNVAHAHYYINNLIKFVFPNAARVPVVINTMGTPGRIAIEINAKTGVGHKMRLYYYDVNQTGNEVFRGITINAMGIVSSEKHYLGVFGNVDKYLPYLKTMIGEDLFRNMFINDQLYMDHNMSLRYIAMERSDYGADLKVYFRNECIVDAKRQYTELTEGGQQ